MTSQNPQFSIVIPTYKRPQRLAQCLQAITRLTFSRDRFEVVVVDDGSPTPMASIAEPFKDSINLEVIRQPNGGPAAARNTGAAAAQGRYLVFTDDDCQVASDWLSVLAEAFERNPQALVGGHTVNALPDNPYSTASQLLIDYIYSYYNQNTEKAMFFASNNFAVPREQYQKIGGFDTSFPLAAGEDREFCDRWQYHEFPTVYAPDMKIYHSHTLTLKSFWRQHFNYGRGAFCFHQIHHKRELQSIQIEPIAFYTRLLTYPFRRSQGIGKPMMSILLFLSQVANTAGFFWESARS